MSVFNDYQHPVFGNANMVQPDTYVIPFFWFFDISLSKCALTRMQRVSSVGVISCVTYDPNNRIIYYIEDVTMDDGTTYYSHTYDMNVNAFGAAVKIADNIGIIINAEWVY